MTKYPFEHITLNKFNGAAIFFGAIPIYGVGTTPQHFTDCHPYIQCFPQVKKERGGGGRYNFSMRSKQIKHSNDHIKGNAVRKGGGAPWYPPLGETLLYLLTLSNHTHHNPLHATPAISTAILYVLKIKM